MPQLHTPTTRPANLDRASSESTTKNRGRQKKTPPLVEPQDVDREWNVREIVAERFVGNDAEYLVEWEEDSQTGRPWPMTWEPRQNLNAESKQYWEEKKRARAAVALEEDDADEGQEGSEEEGHDEEEESRSSAAHPHSPHLASENDVHSSQPIRPPKRRRVLEASEETDDSLPSNQERSIKRPRKAGTATSARYSVSQQSSAEYVQGSNATSHISPSQREIADSYEDEYRLVSGTLVQVQVPDTSHLDLSEYLRMSQLSQPSQELDTGLALPATTPARLRASEYLGSQIVPDSQEELRDSHSYLPTETVTDDTGHTTQSAIATIEVTQSSGSGVSSGLRPASGNRRLQHSDIDEEVELVSSSIVILESPEAARNETLAGNQSPDRALYNDASQASPDRLNGRVISSSSPAWDAAARPVQSSGNPSQHPHWRHLRKSTSVPVESVDNPQPKSSNFVQPKQGKRGRGGASSLSGGSSNASNSPPSPGREVRLRPKRGARAERASVELADEQPSAQITIASSSPHNFINLSSSAFVADSLDPHTHSYSTSSHRHVRENVIEPRRKASRGADRASPPQSPSPHSSHSVGRTARSDGQLEDQDQTDLGDSDDLDRAFAEPHQSSGNLSQLDNSETNPHRSARRRGASQQVTQSSGDSNNPSEDQLSEPPGKAGGGVLASVETRHFNPFAAFRRRPSPPSSGLPDFPDTYGSQPPSRPYEAISPTMADLLGEEGRPLTTAERMKAVHATSVAAARVTRSNSPAVFTPIRQMSPVGMSSKMLPVRESLLPPGFDYHNAQPESTDGDEDDLKVTLGSREYLVLLPLTSRIRDIYKNDVLSYREVIEAVAGGQQFDNVSASAAADMVNRWKLLTDHQDLISEVPASQADDWTEEIEAKFAENSSSKVMFLLNLLLNMRQYQRHVVVFCRPGRMLDILEVVLKMNRIIYDQPAERRRSRINADGSLRVTLVPTDLARGPYNIDKANLVVAFDSTYRSAAVTQLANALRISPSEPGGLAPTVNLAVAHTAEHFELGLPSENTINRLVTLVKYIVGARKVAGMNDDDYPSITGAAEMVAKYVCQEDKRRGWPLPLSLDISGFAPFDINDRDHTARRPAESHIYAQPNNTPYNSKRSLDEDFDATQDIKRMRMTPIPGEDQSGTQLDGSNDSLPNPPVNLSQAAEHDIAKAAALDQAQTEQTNALLAKVVEQRKTEKNLVLEKTTKDLRRLVQKTNNLLQDAAKERALAIAEKDAALAEAAASAKRLENEVTKHNKLKEDHAVIQTELRAARLALSESTVPEVAELAKAQEAVRTKDAELERSEKKLSIVQRDFEFSRTQYQQASTAAVEAAAEARELSAENIVLKRRASDNKVLIAKTQAEHQSAALVAQIKKLQTEKEELRRALHKSSADLAAVKNGRRETRGTSVPRSPRLGGSPRVLPRPTPGASRGNSPAPVDGAAAPVRDPVLFPTSRWNHLRDN